MAENNGDIRDDKGRFGQGNPGKPKGAVTKVSVKVREAIVKFLEDNIDQVESDFKALKTPKERLQFISDILPYAAPKLSSTQVEGEIQQGITIRFEEPADYLYPSQDKGDNGIPESL